MNPGILSVGTKVLHSQYTLSDQLASTGTPDLWTARNDFDIEFLLKIWRYTGDRPDRVVRALWDRELRYLFRLSSAPQSETRLVVLRDAGVDEEHRAFVMVLAAPGYNTLHDLLNKRQEHEWLIDLKATAVRVALWKGIRHLALGLSHLHEQQMIHRNLSTQCVYVDPDSGPESMRLGGFEWTIKVGTLRLAVDPPEFPSDGEARANHTFESDWFSFGGIAAQVFTSPRVSTEPTNYSDLLDAINTSKILSYEEAMLLLRLLEDKPDSRLSHGYDVISALDRIIYSLDQSPRLIDGCHLGLVVTLGPGTYLSRAILEEEPEINALDVESQRAFIERDLRQARVARKGNSAIEVYVLMGNRLGYQISEYAVGVSTRKGQWDLAFSSRDSDLRYSSGFEDQRELRQATIRVFTSLAAKRDASLVYENATSWRRFLPRPDAQRKLEERQRLFHDFFRITNQIELILRDAEVFGYRILSKVTQDGLDVITIRERDRERTPPRFAQISGGMVEFLRKQIAETSEGDRVFLGPEESLYLTRRDKAEFWTIRSIDHQAKIVTLERMSLNLRSPEAEGFLRSLDLFGEMSLIRRRKRAIERLKSHSFLLESLRRPDLVYIDTGVTDLPQDIDPDRVDPAKVRALHQIWRTRPIYALQGPPGTGKTTLIAHLLGQIFADDPVAQVLVTAQAHAAVDVLREKVTAEIFESDEADEKPLSIRLPRSKGQPDDDPDSVSKVTLKMLERAESKIQERSDIERRWLLFVRQAITGLRGPSAVGGLASGLCELVRRSANITYSSTTAGNLEELADSTLSFDWSIIEEAGKAHGFDLVLPLQTGHRWLLIGDQNQLPPYRYKDFEEALRNIDEVVDALAELPDRGGGLVDMDLVLRWKLLDARPDNAGGPGAREQHRAEWRRWLKTFKEIHDSCARATAQKGSVAINATPMASMLSHQHRMHPTIADLISVAYYDEPLISETQSRGVPLPRVVHPFISPSRIEGKSIVWIDVPSFRDGGQGEVGPPSHLPYVAPDEVDAIKLFIRSLRTLGAAPAQLKVAVLSPYKQQVILLQEALRPIQAVPPDWMYSGGKQKQLGSTVDSYQGNQADIVIVSLVRNNDSDPGTGLGFLAEAARMNVLFSRAEKLLVLVGSWSFFEHQMRSTPPDKHQPLGHWRLALDFLTRAFDSGQAVRFTTSELLDI